MKQDEKKDCYNCKYFLRYYINTSGYFNYIHKGHCKNTCLTYKQADKRIENNLPCEFWQPRELQKEETKEKNKGYAQIYM